LGLFAGGFFLFFLVFTSWQTYNLKGHVKIPHKGMPDTYLYGESAEMTIITFAVGGLFVFILGGYFSVLYIRIWLAQRECKIKIIPENCDIDKMEKLICSSCSYSRPIYFSTDLICPKCKSQMEEISSFVERKGYRNYKKPTNL
jgi:hypothetical protein